MDRCSRIIEIPEDRIVFKASPVDGLVVLAERLDLDELDELTSRLIDLQAKREHWGVDKGVDYE